MYICGKNVAIEKLNSNERINKIYLAKNFSDNEIFNLIKKRKVKFTFVANSFLDSKVTDKHQGIVLDVDDVKAFDIDYITNIKKNNPIVVMLDHIEDPHNFGAIIRTCEALGIDGIIIPNDRSVGINSTVVKTSAGAIYNIPIIRIANLNVAVNKLKKLGYWIVGTDMDGQNYYDINYNMPVCLIIGNEGKGMNDSLIKNCDYIAKIPMEGKINSLNASVSCGIILSHIVASRR